NGLDDFGVRQLDWRFPPNNLQVPVVLAADLMYELRNVEPVVALIKQVLAPGGLCLMADEDRMPACVIRDALGFARLAFTSRHVKAGERGGRRLKGTLYRIIHAESCPKRGRPPEFG